MKSTGLAWLVVVALAVGYSVPVTSEVDRWTIDGIALSDSKAVVDRVSRDTTAAAYDQNNHVVNVFGDSLELNGVSLLRSGDDESRVPIVLGSVEPIYGPDLTRAFWYPACHLIVVTGCGLPSTLDLLAFQHVDRPIVMLMMGSMVDQEMNRPPPPPPGSINR